MLRGAGYQSETFASAEDFLAGSHFDAPDCILLDLLNGRAPGLNGLELQQALAAGDRQLPIVFVTGHGDVRMSVRAMKAGAVDFLLKPFNNGELLKSIAEALNRSHLEQIERAEIAEIRRRLSTLTSRERDVLCRLISGQINKQIAADLGTVEKTIKVHRARIMKKMGTDSFAKLVTMIVRIGIQAPATPSTAGHYGDTCFSLAMRLFQNRISKGSDAYLAEQAPEFLATGGSFGSGNHP